MRQSWGLSAMLARVFERGATSRSADDSRDLPALCDALLSQEGEVSGYQLAATLLARYRSANADERAGFFTYLNTHLDLDAAKIAQLAAEYGATPTPAHFEALLQAAEPRRQELLRRLNQPGGATRALVDMRVDLLRAIKADPDLRRTDHDFVHLLSSWFNRGFLVLQEINWNTPATILDKIVAYEAVHQISGLDDLRRRLAPSDRRCFAFFHPSMPDEPLIFVEVALGTQIPGSIAGVLSEDRAPLPAEAATTATFYSISNCQRGLAGISFGNLLIKQVVAELSSALPGIERFVTLSPIPGLVRWLQTMVDDPEWGVSAGAALRNAAADAELRALAARYLLCAKRESGQPLDPVARFHLGNGAEIHDIHAGADLSDNGIGQSRGVMVNYLYDLTRTEENHADFALRDTIRAADELWSIASTEPNTPSKGKVA